MVSLPGSLEVDLIEDVEIIYDDHSSIETVRRGGMANIQRAKWKSRRPLDLYGDIPIAVKFFHSNQSPLSEDEIAENFVFETALMGSLPPSPNVIQLLGFSSIAKALVMPYYDLSLSAYIRKGKGSFRLSPSKILKIASDIANGMALIHNAEILHLDLKPCK